jgi:nucleoside-diphosphate-sugar epimerase
MSTRFECLTAPLTKTNWVRSEYFDKVERSIEFHLNFDSAGHAERKPIVRFQGDFDDQATLWKATTGVKWIINCAQLLEHDQIEEFDRCNVQNLTLLVDAAIACNVPYLLHLSTASVCCGSNSNYYGAENTVQVPRRHLLPQYGRSKYQAELVIERANGRPLGDGFGRLRTLTLRPTILYGELDRWFVPRAMKVATSLRGTLPRISNVYIRLQPCYVGNAAWAVCCAKKRIERDASVGGETFFVTDDTPIRDPFDFWQPYLAQRQLKVSSWAVPLWIVLALLSLIQLVVTAIRPLIRIRLGPEWSGDWWNMICTTHFFNRTKITLRMEYDPLYSVDEAMQKSREYYEKCAI